MRVLATAQSLKTFHPQAKRSRSPADTLPKVLEALAPLGADIEATAWAARPARPGSRATLPRQPRSTLQAIATSLIVVTLHLAMLKVFLTIGAA